MVAEYLLFLKYVIYIYISTIHHGSLPSDFSNGRLGAQVVDHHGPGDEALHREIRREALEDFLGKPLNQPWDYQGIYH